MNQLILIASLISFAVAAPTATGHHGNAVNYGTGGGIIGFLVLLLDIYIFLELFKSSRPGTHKLLWALAVFFFPILGAALYFLFADRAKYNNYSAIEEV
ncbi:hypothetical protein BCR37DRAFT_391893 [Protomyces lactucae-debilis]|uniref:Cardiolipin synthase N-terminal domain-containing protein n=1 Tax=Protomyces lactucae-debilis TaxID=2754530 RepID=A0A1Y2FK08_PROLT|nr:uncharacterized protein BCR37DRAFT_391893 [Protomyces lactucae-debilis]ORY84303.1 hypothetical protein BCR37DRAFT_391893 [Protomyces lactucae-debilis]